MDTPLVDYDKLAAAYWDNLSSQLRGFDPTSQFPFLKTWVHDENDADSVLNILECAHDFGVPRLQVHIGADAARRLDRANLEAKAAELGALTTTETNGALDYNIDFSLAAVTPVARKADAQEKQGLVIRSLHRAQSERSADNAPAGSSDAPAKQGLDIHPRYRAQLERILSSSAAGTSLLHEGELQSDPALRHVEAQVSGVTLAALVTENHFVQKAAFRGTSDPLQRAQLEWISAWLEGRPLQDCADHAAIAAEFALRDPAQPLPVSGIVQPENADRSFVFPSQLVRTLLARYRDAYNYQRIDNFFDPPCADAWLAKAAPERLAAVRGVLASLPRFAGIEVLRLEGNKRIIVGFGTPCSNAEKQASLFAAERALKKALDPELQVYLEPVLDLNVLRKGKLQES